MHLEQLTRLIRRRRTIRRRCQAALRSVPKVVPFSAEALCAAVAAQRGCTILLASDAGQDGLSGWVELTAVGYTIHFDPDPTADRQKIILHELSHILLGHLDQAPAALTAPPPFLSEVRLDWLRTLRGGTYDSIEEQEAETLASLVRLRDAAADVTAAAVPDPVAAGLIGRWHQFYLEDRQQ